MEENRPETYEKYIRALMDISQAITSDRYLEDILKLIVMVTARVTGVEICSLWLIDETADPKKIRLKATQAIAPDYLKDRSLSLDEGVVGFVATHNQPLIIRDVSKEPRFKEKEMAKKLGLISMVSVPLQVKDEKVIGVLNCFTSQPHEFTDTEVYLITTVAFYIATTRIYRHRSLSHYNGCKSGGGRNPQHRAHGENQGNQRGAGDPKTGGTCQRDPYAQTQNGR